MFSDEVLNVVLSNPKLAERLASRPDDLTKVKKIFKEIHGEFSPTVVNSAVKIIDATFLKLYDGVNLEVFPGTNFHDLKEKYHIFRLLNQNMY